MKPTFTIAHTRNVLYSHRNNVSRFHVLVTPYTPKQMHDTHCFCTSPDSDKLFKDCVNGTPIVLGFAKADDFMEQRMNRWVVLSIGMDAAIGVGQRLTVDEVRAV